MPNVAALYSPIPPPLETVPAYAPPEMRNFAHAVSLQYGFEPLLITGWLNNTITAYLTDVQVTALKLDARVLRINADGRIRPSANAWYDSTGPQSQRISWGKNAVGGYWGYTMPNDNVRIYIVDAGVGFHVDLPNVIERHSIGGIPVVGCYAHATHVAGIAGGTGTGSLAAYGVNRGVKMVSISIIEFPHQFGGNCGLLAFYTEQRINATLNLARQRISATVICAACTRS